MVEGCFALSNRDFGLSHQFSILLDGIGIVYVVAPLAPTHKALAARRTIGPILSGERISIYDDSVLSSASG
jgi:hypothetical protein